MLTHLVNDYILIVCLSSENDNENLSSHDQYLHNPTMYHSSLNYFKIQQCTIS